jgi:hypothetical protein|tara:strand:+ start:96 stop:338 length:243 start_codon:yes stop_codon:yes gene_type:complete
MLAQTNASGIVRDLSNNALLANDISARQTQREEFRRKQEMVNKLNDINIMKEQIQECLSLRDEIAEIKQMLYNHIQRERT